MQFNKQKTQAKFNISKKFNFFFVIGTRTIASNQPTMEVTSYVRKLYEQATLELLFSGGNRNFTGIEKHLRGKTLEKTIDNMVKETAKVWTTLITEWDEEDEDGEESNEDLYGDAENAFFLPFDKVNTEFVQLCKIIRKRN